MSARFFRKLGIQTKIETTYADDAEPAAADAVLMSDVTFTPLVAERVQRDLLLPYMGNPGVILAGIYARLEGSIEIAGSGTPGLVPKYGSIFRAGGLAETIIEDEAVEYTIIENGRESVTTYFAPDGVRHVLLGAQVNIAPSFVPKQMPRWRVTMLGLLGTISDIAVMPAVNKAGWTTPVPVSKANTTMSLHDWPSVAESLSLDLGNVLTPRFLIGDEKILISNRSSTGSAVVEARKLADVNWFDKALTREPGPLSIVHGKTPGNIVEITAPAVEIGEPTQGQTDGILNYTLPLDLTPVNGTDELKIIVR